MIKRYGIYDLKNKRFVFNIDAESKNRACREYQQRTGRPVGGHYVVRSITPNWKNPRNPKYEKNKFK